jgi:hypothetical protein
MQTQDARLCRTGVMVKLTRQSLLLAGREPAPAGRKRARRHRKARTMGDGFGLIVFDRPDAGRSFLN